MNEITEEKNKAIAAAAANRNKAKTEANAARKALAAGRFQSAANKAALEKKLKNAEENIKRAATEKVEALKKAANEKNELQRKAEENKQASMKGAVVANRMKIALQKKRNAQNELRKLASNKEVNFTRNINRVTLNGVKNLRNRIIKAGKAKANANAARTLAQFKANRKKAKENANRLAREKAEKAKQEKIAKAKAEGEAIRAAREKANENRRKQNARNAEANKAATARRIALEKKQAAAKQRREMQEQGRGKREAEKEAAKANAKKEKTNMNARMKATRNKLTENKAKNALINARIAYRMNVLMATREGRLPQNQKEYWTRQANTAMNMSTIQGVDKMFKIHLEKLKREKNAATKIQAAFKGGQVRKSVGGASMGKDILKKHISGVDVMAGKKIDGFTGKRVEDKGYERDWLKRVDEEGDTAVKRAKLKKMFDDKFELKKTLLRHEQSNIRKGYGPLRLRTLKTQVMRPRIDQTQSTKGTNQNAAILNVARIKKKIEEARNRYNSRLNKMTTKYNNPMFANNKMPKNTKSSAAFNMKGGFNGGIRLGSGGNKAINGSNVKITFKPSLKNITQKKVIRPTRMAGNTLIKAGQITQAKKNAVGNVAAARKAYTNQSKFALNQRKARAKKRVELSLKSEAGKNAARYKKMINEGKINAAMSEVDKKVMQLRRMGKKVEIQPKLK